MTAFFGPLLAAAIVVQIPGEALKGTVVDDRGKPVAGVRVVFHASPPRAGKLEPVVAETDTDAKGRFRLTISTPGRGPVNGGYVWGYRPGWAVTAASSYRLPPALVLRRPEPRAVRIEGADRKPVAGVLLSVQTLCVSGNAIPGIPDSLRARLSVTTGADGTAALDFLALGDQLVAVEVTADSIGTQEFQLIERPGREAQSATVSFRVGPTSRLTGRVRTRAGKPVAG